MHRLILLLSLALPMASVTAHAEQFPDHPVRVIVVASPH
jgi:hypothetical protein